MRIFYTEVYVKWFKLLKDKVAKVAISRRLEKIKKHNHLGDAKYLGDDVYELRIHYGAGFRLYFHKQGDDFILLLCGGDKSSQTKDIEQAKMLIKKETK